MFLFLISDFIGLIDFFTDFLPPSLSDTNAFAFVSSYMGFWLFTRTSSTTFDLLGYISVCFFYIGVVVMLIIELM